MTSGPSRDQMLQLSRLGKRRHEVAATALAEARANLLDKQRILDEQQELIGSMRDEIAELDQRRYASGILDADSVRLATERRRWLVFDLEKEVFYIDMMVYDVEEAEQSVAECRHEWVRLGERVKALQTELQRVTQHETQRREIRAEADYQPAAARMGVS